MQSWQLRLRSRLRLFVRMRSNVGLYDQAPLAWSEGMVLSSRRNEISLHRTSCPSGLPINKYPKPGIQLYAVAGAKRGKSILRRVAARAAVSAIQWAPGRFEENSKGSLHGRSDVE